MLFCRLLLSTFSIFYFFGVLAIVWSVVWFKTISETPKDDPYIDHHELTTIRNAIGFTHEQQKVCKMCLSICFPSTARASAMGGYYAVEACVGGDSGACV